jgi:sarcosine oxidase subunit alpha
VTRLAKQPGERLDRSQTLTFSFDGRPIQAFAGDTIASALLAQGRWTLSRSFKYHRPRGELCGCGQCANSLVTVDGRPGVRACGEPVSAGMEVTHQNAWPSLDWDLMRLTDKLAGPFTPVGFYYKTFIRPRRLWPLYERVLRNAAGLGRLPKRQGKREWVTEYRRRHCDVLVIGGGVSGLAAASTAAEAGLDVVLCDEDTEPGGVALAEGHGELVVRLLARATAAGVEVLVRGAALGFFDGLVPVWQGNTLHQVRARRHVLATGAIQQPLVFHDNDLPGVMLSGGARRLAALYAVKPGQRAVVATVDDRGIKDALALRGVGVEVAAVADLRDASSAGGALAAELLEHGIELVSSSTVVRAAGGRHVSTATVARVDQDGRAVAGSARKIECDLVAVSGGAQPALSLLLQAGGRASYDPHRSAFVVAEVPEGMHVAGLTAEHEDCAELSGQAAALEVIAALDAGGIGVGEELAEIRARMRESRPGAVARAPVVATPPACATDGGRAGRCFVDLDEDVTTKDVANAVAEGYDSLELSKRYTTATMGPSQGRFSQLAAARAVARATGLSLQDVGLTTARPPWSTVPLGVLAGRPFEPAKRSSLHARHRSLDAGVRWAGDWRRAYDYGNPQGEALAVQRTAGLIDVSTLGKLLVQGPDAGELLDRMYPNRISNLKPGRIRYGVMLSEAGRITDDGTVCRIDDVTFYLTTTSTGATAVEQQLTWWLTAWGLDAHVTDLSQGVSAMNLAGPRARGVLAGLTELDCSADAFRYLDARNAVVAGVPALILRIGFVGELGYEIHCPAPQAPHLWDTILSADLSRDAGSQGRDAAVVVTPFGLEPQRILRLQKLHVLVGQDTDSESTPFNTAMDWIVKLDKAQDFIGRWALEQTAAERPTTQLVGFTVPSGEVVAEGAVVLQDGASSGCQVTSSRWSPNLGASIGMATVPEELARDGAQIEISYAGRTHTALVTTRPFYDPDGEVLRS